VNFTDKIIGYNNYEPALKNYFTMIPDEALVYPQNNKVNAREK